MALKLVFAFSVLFVFSYCESIPENCREIQFKLLPVGEGFASEFRRKANEKGVRQIYLNLKIGNNSYDPLELQDEFLPHRWVWAGTITEPMLSLPDDYDILSMGLLTYQVRSVDVQLQDQPSGCLANLNSTCQNLAVGRMLLQNVTMGTSDELSLVTQVVCGEVLNWSIQFHQHINYNCCSMHKGPNGPSTVCDLTFYGQWFNGFDGIIITLWILMSLFIPALPLLLPDCEFSHRREIHNENLSEQRENRAGPADQQKNIGRADLQRNEASRRDQEATAHNRNSSNGQSEMILEDIEDESPESDPSSNEHQQRSEPYTSSNEHQQRSEPYTSSNEHQQRSEPYTSSNGYQQREEENKMIPVDDASPMTFSTLLLKCSEAMPDVGLSFNIKLFLVYVFVLPCFIYLQLGLYNTLKKTHINESIKRRISLGKIFTKHIHWAIFATFGVKEIIWFVALTFTSLSIVLFLRPKNFIFGQGTSCRICKEDHTNRDSNHSLGDEIVLHLKIVPDRLKEVILKFKILLRPLPISRESTYPFFPSIFILFTLLLRVVFGAICFPFILVWSHFVVFWYSPLPVILWFFLVNEPRLPSSDAANADVCKNLLLKSYAFFGSMSFCYTIVMIIVMSCGFINKVLGYTIAGLVLNEDVITPYVAFFFVVTTNIYLCYANMQNKYKEVKEMIFKRQRELEINSNDPEGTIRTELFWFVCDKVLTIKSEIWRMFCNMALILLFLFLVVYSIIVFGNEYKVSAVFSTIYVFIGGLIPALVFKGLTKDNKFIGWAKLNIEREIETAVTEYSNSKDIIDLSPFSTVNDIQDNFA